MSIVLFTYQRSGPSTSSGTGPLVIPGLPRNLTLSFQTEVEPIHLVISSGGEAGVEKSAAQLVQTRPAGLDMKSESRTMGLGGAWDGVCQFFFGIMAAKATSLSLS